MLSFKPNSAKPMSFRPTKLGEIAAPKIDKREQPTNLILPFVRRRVVERYAENNSDVVVLNNGIRIKTRLFAI